MNLKLTDVLSFYLAYDSRMAQLRELRYYDHRNNVLDNIASDDAAFKGVKS